MRYVLVCLGAVLLCCSSVHSEPNDYCTARTEISVLHSMNPTGLNGACLSYRIREMPPSGIWIDVGAVGDTYKRKTRTFSRVGLMVGVSGSINKQARFGMGFSPEGGLLLYARVAIIR